MSPAGETLRRSRMRDRSGVNCLGSPAVQSAEIAGRLFDSEDYPYEDVTSQKIRRGIWSLHIKKDTLSCRLLLLDGNSERLLE